MDALNTQNQLEMARNVHDLGSINTMREAIASGDEGVLKEAAQQFEAIFVQMMLKSMRKAQDALADENSPFNSQQVKFYRDMHDQQLANDLSSGGGMGLADLIVKQLGQQDDSYQPASTIRSDGDFASLNAMRRAATTELTESAVSSNSMGVSSATKNAMFSSPEDFIDTLRPIAEKVAQDFGLDPKAMIAQAAVETGWGKYVIHNAQGNSSHNLFGIKANNGWQGEQVTVSTLEFVDQIPQQQKAAFRQYDTLESGMRDYANFITSQPRYAHAVDNAGDAKQYTQALQDAGYATDPNYAKKIMSVYSSDRLGARMP